MIVDGRAIASDILASVRERSAKLGRPPIVRAIVMCPNAATESYLRIKSARAVDAGMQLEVVRLRGEATTADAIAAVQREGADAVIVQLPLPSTIVAESVLEAIPLEKDVDVLSAKAYAAFVSGMDGALIPPVAGAVKEILERAHISVSGARAVVIGNGKLVGTPVAAWLTQSGAEVSVLTKESEEAISLEHADIVVSGAGAAHLITKDMVFPGNALIDAGTSELSGVLAGDMHPDCASVARLFTPVPGGVGPIAVARLFKNVAEALRI